jgi:hypothetical protein
MNIKDLVKNDQSVIFDHYKNGELWYFTEWKDDNGIPFLFPVPIDDVGDATFKNCDKALLFMRWIRKHIEAIETAKKECSNE